MIAPLLARREWSAGIASVVSFQLLAVQFGFPALGCPIREFFGVSCPGCGLTTATLHLCRGEWRAGVASHAFAPVFMLGIAGGIVAGLLPGDWRRHVLLGLEHYERRSGIVAAVGVALILYWGLRVAFGN